MQCLGGSGAEQAADRGERKWKAKRVIAGVDTHKDVHVLCLLDGLGRKIWSGSFRADPEGYDRLAEAIGDPGSCAVVGVGAGVVRGRADEEARGARVQRGRGAQAQEGQGEARRGEERPAGRRGAAQGGVREGAPCRSRRTAGSRRCASLRRAQAGRRDVHVLRGLREVDATTAPGALRERFRGRERPKDLMPLSRAGERPATRSRRACWPRWAVRRGGLEGGPQPVESCDERIRALLEANAPALLGVEGCGRRPPPPRRGRRRQPRQAEGRGGVLDAVRRLPIPASSGKTERHRLNRGGNRQANWALYEIAIKRMAYDERTRRYVARRTSEGEVPEGGDPLPEALHSAGGVPRAHGPEPRRRGRKAPSSRRWQGDAGDSEAGRRRARPVRSHTRAPGTWETAVDETGEKVLRAPVRIEGSAPQTAS